MCVVVRDWGSSSGVSSNVYTVPSMFRVVDRSKLSLKFGKDTFIDCHFSPFWPSWARTETAFALLRTTFLFAVDVNDDDGLLDNLNLFFVERRRRRVVVGVGGVGRLPLLLRKTTQCCSSRFFSRYIYIYMCVCVCVCVCIIKLEAVVTLFFFKKRDDDVV